MAAKLTQDGNKTVYKLSNGVQVPGLGFGTFANEGAVGETKKAVTCALEAGYRHLDCAWFYGNESEVGEAVKEFLAAHPDVTRKDIFIVTKVWNHLHEPEEVEWSINNSLKNFGLDYVDCFLVHWPIAAEKVPDESKGFVPKLGADGKYVIKHELTKNPRETWKAMEKLYNDGKAKAIGVSNWSTADLDAMFAWGDDLKVAPMVNQIEVHPFLPNEKLVKYCQDKNILVAAYSPLGSQDQVPNTGEKVRTNVVLNETAEKSGLTLAQLLLAWGLRRGYAVLPKSSTPSRIESNFQVPEISDADFEAVQSVAKGRHTRFVNMKDTFGYDPYSVDVDAPDYKA